MKLKEKKVVLKHEIENGEKCHSERNRNITCQRRRSFRQNAHQDHRKDRHIDHSHNGTHQRVEPFGFTDKRCDRYTHDNKYCTENLTGTNYLHIRGIFFDYLLVDVKTEQR